MADRFCFKTAGNGQKNLWLIHESGDFCPFYSFAALSLSFRLSFLPHRYHVKAIFFGRWKRARRNIIAPSLVRGFLSQFWEKNFVSIVEKKKKVPFYDGCFV